MEQGIPLSFNNSISLVLTCFVKEGWFRFEPTAVNAAALTQEGESDRTGTQRRRKRSQRWYRRWHRRRKSNPAHVVTVNSILFTVVHVVIPICTSISKYTPGEQIREPLICHKNRNINANNAKTHFH